MIIIYINKPMSKKYSDWPSFWANQKQEICKPAAISTKIEIARIQKLAISKILNIISELKWLKI